MFLTFILLTKFISLHFCSALCLFKTLPAVLGGGGGGMLGTP